MNWDGMGAVPYIYPTQLLYHLTRQPSHAYWAAESPLLDNRFTTTMWLASTYNGYAHYAMGKITERQIAAPLFGCPDFPLGS